MNNDLQTNINFLNTAVAQCAGSLISNSGLDSKDSVQIAIAEICKVALEMTKGENGYDGYLSKPFFRATNLLLKARLKEVENEIKGNKEARDMMLPMIASYNQAIDLLTNLSESIQKTEV